jgi:hypothetical protein
MAWSRALVLLLLVLTACPGETVDTASATQAGTGTGTTGTDTTAGSSSGSSTTATTESVTTGPPDECASHPAGDWAACRVNNTTNNSLCGFEANGHPGKITCLSPQSGSYNACGVRDCVEDCDCFAPPKTGTAIPVCLELFADGGKACVLYCVNGQICPDGMECVAGTCYWPG